RSWSSFIGICIAIAGNALISLALNIQKYSHTRLQREAERRRMGRLKPQQIETRRDDTWSVGIEEEEEEEQDDEEDEPLLSRTLSRPSRSGSGHHTSSPHEQSMLLSHFGGDGKGNSDVSYMTSPYWWLGLTIMFFGEAGNFLAYGFAPASIVSPLGVVALISNCVVAPVMLKEPFRRRDVFGVLVSVAGAVVVVLSAEKEETKLGPDEILDAISQTAFEIYFAVTCVLILILMRLSSRFGNKTIIIDLGLVALFGAYTVLSTKGISSLISSSFYHIFQYPIAYLFTFVLVSTAILQVKYINRALQRFDSTQVIPTQFVLFTISVIVGSAILYRDFETVNRERMLKFITGCSLTFVGVYLISSQRQNGS
ncbi:magnesium transporter NIPA-domain-containing protein, partial [Trichophaea hybrida]